MDLLNDQILRNVNLIESVFELLPQVVQHNRLLRCNRHYLREERVHVNALDVRDYVHCLLALQIRGLPDYLGIRNHLERGQSLLRLVEWFL